MRFTVTVALLVLSTWPRLTAAQSRIEVGFAAELVAEPVDGRIIVLISHDGETEPRMQVTAGIDAIQIFGVDVE